VQVSQNKKVGIKPPLRWCPTIEPIEYKKNLPCAVTKKTILVLYAIFSCVIFFTVVASFSAILESENKEFTEEKDPTFVDNPISKVKYANISGIFGQCAPKSIKTLAYFMYGPDSWQREDPSI